ncbi:MAG: hypothetical protein J07HN6_02195 [Halonotius sp. J07HN6]|nr:MAG: hypothetical protein J07HN6_02195 [Halonotius sp. J07HN6]
MGLMTIRAITGITRYHEYHKQLQVLDFLHLVVPILNPMIHKDSKKPAVLRLRWDTMAKLWFTLNRLLP